MTDSPVGTRVAIEVAGSYSINPTHEIVGHQGDYLLICPISAVQEIKPGQDWVPVTRITSDRVSERV